MGENTNTGNSNTTLVKVKWVCTAQYRGGIKNSNTTLVKVKCWCFARITCYHSYSNTTLVKVKLRVER